MAVTEQPATTEPTWENVALSQLQEVLHHLIDRVRVHSEPELAWLHSLVHRFDPNWTPPPASGSSDAVEIPGFGQVSPQQFAAFQAWQSEKAQEAARAEAVAAAAAQPWNPAAQQAATAPQPGQPAPQAPAPSAAPQAPSAQPPASLGPLVPDQEHPQ